MADAKPTGMKLMWLQFKLLVNKNLAVKKRNGKATLIQFLLPFIVNFFLFIITIDDKYNPEGFNKRTWDVKQPDATLVGGLPVCDTFRMPNCVTPLAIVHSAADDESRAFVGSVVARMLASNEHIEATAVRYFNSSLDFNVELAHAPMSMLVAVHFTNNFKLTAASLAAAEITLQYNTTRSCVFGDNDCTTPWEDVALPTQIAVEKALMGELATLSRGASAEVSLDVQYQPFPNPELADYQRNFDEIIGPIFVLMGCLFSFYIQCSNLVVEKEKKLKLQMRMMGTRDTPMWLSWWLFFIGESTISALMWVISGMLFRFRTYTNTSVSISFFFFLALHLGLAGFACFLSTCLQSTAAALGVALFLFLFNWLVGGIISVVIFSDLVPRYGRNMVALIPSVLYNKGIRDLTDAVGANGDGLRWHERHDNGNICETYCPSICACDYGPEDNEPPGDPYFIFPIGEIMEWLVFDWLFYGLLAVYLDNVLPNAFGRRLPAWYLLLPSYWGLGQTPPSDTASDVSDEGHAYDDDVLREQERVLGGADAASDAIRVVNLCKRFGNPKRGWSFTAVHKINFGVKHDQLFCLLGHNGAGKTTTFNMLSGMFPPTKGDAFVFGKSVRHELRQVQGMMGICPQHDVLWSELSASEHLRLFAGLSLVASSAIADRIAYFLEAVDLVEWRDKPCGTYSGGMRRRLSVACSLIADPRVVYLDEPTTGMDPVNRRGVWDVIEKAKKNRVVVLTTHAMEEADTLGDVISIMSRGRLHCLGTSLHLKNKFGSGYQLDVTCAEETAPQVADFLAAKVPQHRRASANAFTASVPLSKVADLEALYAAVEGGEGARLKLELAVSMCTLESVFIKIAHQANDPEALRQAGNLPEYRNNVSSGGGSGASSPSEAGAAAAAAAAAAASPPAVVTLSVTCPAGCKEGDPIQIQHEGAPFNVTVPAGIAEGQAFTVSLASSAAAPPPPPPAGAVSRDDLGEDPCPDTEGLLVKHTDFKSPSFGLQFKALFLKNLTYQKRQCCTNVTFLIVTCLWMFILILMKSLPGWIGFPTNYQCGSNETDSYQVQLTIPNLDVLYDVQASLEAVATLETCSHPDHYNATEWDKMQGWARAAMCSTSSLEQPSARERERMRDAFSLFECNGTLFDEVEAQFAWFREADDVHTYCSEDLRPNVTAEVGGLTIEFTQASCGEAQYAFFATCESPTVCPDDDEPDRPDELSDRAEVLADFAKYNCSADANARILPYTSFPPDLAGGGVQQCLSDYMCEPEYADDCGGVPAMLQSMRYLNGQYVGGFPQCAGGESGSGSGASRRRRALLLDEAATMATGEGGEAGGEEGGEAAAGGGAAWTAREHAELLRAYAKHVHPDLMPAPQRTTAASSHATAGFGPWATFFGPRAAAAAQRAAALHAEGGAFTQARAYVGALMGAVGEGGDPAAPADDARGVARRAREMKRVARALAGKRGAAAMLRAGRNQQGQRQSRRRLQQLEGGSSDNDIAQCLADGSQFCTGTVIIDECPNSLDVFQSKTLPVGASAAEPAIGGLMYEPESVADTTCRADGDCWERLQNLAPTVKRGVLGNFTLREGLGDTNQVLGAPNVTCQQAEGAASGACEVALAELNVALYDKWYDSGRADIDYDEDDEGGRREQLADSLEGAYEGAYFFSGFSLPSLAFAYTTLYNSTYWGGFDTTRFYFNREPEVGALGARLHAAIAKTLLGESAEGQAILAAGYDGTPVLHMDFPRLSRTWATSWESFIDHYVVMFVLSFCFPLQVMLLVSEKQQYMREVMTMTGLRRSAFWTINWLYAYFVFVCQMTICLMIGFGGGFRIFVSHDVAVPLLLYLIYGTALTSFGCFFSTFFNNRTVGGVVACCVVFLGGLYGWIIGETAVATSALDTSRVQAAALIPIWGGLIAQRIIADAAPGFTGTGAKYLTLSNIEGGSTTPVGTYYGLLILDLLLYTAAFVYLDMTLKVGPGVKQRFDFFLRADFWRKPPPTDPRSFALEPPVGEAPEVAAERKRALETTGGVRALGLAKQYPGAAKYAVQNVQFAIQTDECFGLLGSNGAGKSTTIHMLCGVHEPSMGTVLCGADSELDVRRDMPTIQAAMGVCTQDNLLWGEMTGAEHLRFFGRLRRLSPKELGRHIDYWLRRVNLAGRADKRKRSRAYSGGMKRRLSVANALIGNPLLVYLDEPSTGLDPESRRQLWHAVLAAKKGKSIILTTHALEEAEALCDRVGIMTRGLMRTLGTPTELRLHFDQGYKFMLAVESLEHEAAASAFVAELLPGAAIRDSINGVLTYDVPKKNVVMSRLFAQMEQSKGRLSVKDWGLSHTTLEEVFLKIVADSTPGGAATSGAGFQKIAPAEPAGAQVEMGVATPTATQIA